MLTKEAKLKIFNKILKTDDFKSSGTYNKLLSYLVESSLNEIKLKEYSIAVDVFEKDSHFNPSEDSSVRVYVSNLRKKLDHYYSTEGKDEKYKIVIPKGHYDLDFISVHSKRKDNIEKSLKPFLYLLSLLMITLILILIFKYSPFKKYFIDDYNPILVHPVWKNITESNNQKLIVLGNDLFFLEKINNEETIVRKHYINTKEEFNRYKKEHPEKQIKGITPYSFFPKIDFSTIPILIKILRSKDKLVLKSSMELTTADLLKNDIFFIGSFRSLHFLNYILRDNLIEYSSDPDNMYIRLHDNDTTITFTQSGEPGFEHVDYCLFRKIPGPNKNTIYMFISFFKASISVSAQYMLNEENLNELSKMMKEKYGDVPMYFDVLFKSRGYSRTAFKTSVEFTRKITAENMDIW